MILILTQPNIILSGRHSQMTHFPLHFSSSPFSYWNFLDWECPFLQLPAHLYCLCSPNPFSQYFSATLQCFISKSFSIFVWLFLFTLETDWISHLLILCHFQASGTSICITLPPWNAFICRFSVFLAIFLNWKFFATTFLSKFCFPLLVSLAQSHSTFSSFCCRHLLFNGLVPLLCPLNLWPVFGISIFLMYLWSECWVFVT